MQSNILLHTDIGKVQQQPKFVVNIYTVHITSYIYIYIASYVINDTIGCQSLQSDRVGQVTSTMQYITY